MKKFFSILLLCVIFVLSFSSCSKLFVCNSIDTEYANVVKQNGKTYIKLQNTDIYLIDLESKSFDLADDREGLLPYFENNTPDALKCFYFAGEYDSTVPENYKGVIPHIKNCELKADSSVVDACGYISGDKLVGFVQVYKDMRGPYGNYSIEEIDHSLVFSYDAQNDKFNVEYTLEDVVIVALHESSVIYWKDKKYYLYDLKNKTEVYLVDDKAYDSGLTQYSTSGVYSNSEICVIHMIKGMSTKDVCYVYVYSWKNGKLLALRQKNM